MRMKDPKKYRRIPSRTDCVSPFAACCALFSMCFDVLIMFQILQFNIVGIYWHVGNVH